MNKLQENKLRMYLLVEKVCNENAPVWDEFLPFSGTVKKLSEQIVTIEETRQKQDQSYKGVTDDKDFLNEKLVDTALKHISALKVYAVLKNDQALLQKISFTKTTFDRARVTGVIDKCQLIYNKAIENLDQLAQYSITESEMQEFMDLITRYRNIFTETSETRNERLLATEKLKGLIKETDFILKTQLDNLIYFYKDTNLEFYNLYQKSRRVVKYGVRYENDDQEQENVTLTSQIGTQSQAA